MNKVTYGIKSPSSFLLDVYQISSALNHKTWREVRSKVEGELTGVLVAAQGFREAVK